MREQFLKLLAENPNNINIGLIYADWLAERGDPEEAYWRDPRIYTQAWTAIFDQSSELQTSSYYETFPPAGRTQHGGGDGCGIEIGMENGDGYGSGCYNIWGDGLGDGYEYGNTLGNGFSDAKSPVHFLNIIGRLVSFEVLMDGRYVLVCELGFVLVGDVSPHPSDWQRIIVDHCATVRQWGTTRGLGQLALEGPQPETILDYEGNGVDVLRATILRAIPCNETAWEKYPELITKPAE